MEYRVEVVEVLPAAQMETLAAFELEQPRMGSWHGGFGIRFAAWFVGRSAPVDEVSIDLAGDCLKRWKVGARPDVAAARAVGDPSMVAGFEGVLQLAGVGLLVDLEVMVRCGGVIERAAIVRLAVRHMTPQYQRRHAPLLVTSSGRCGSTSLMAMLNTHPDILVDGPFPFEHKVGLFWAHTSVVVTSPADRLNSTHGFEFETDRTSLGLNPYLQVLPEALPHATRWAAKKLPEAVFDQFARLTDDYYDAVAVDSGKSPRAKYFAEKAFGNFLPAVLGELCDDTREVILVRDPRDMYASILSYQRKTGYRSYMDALGFADESEHLAYLADRMEKLLRHWKQRRRREAVLVRYEQMVTEPAATIDRVFDYLAIDRSPTVLAAAVAAASRDTDTARGHATTPSLESSIGRWRRDLPEPIRRMACAAFAKLLPEFGYPD